MAVVAYLRVSTEKQFLENQREEIIRFAEKNGLSIDRWYMETVSGKVSSKERKLAGLYGAQNETYIEGWEKKTSNLLIYKRLCKI